MRTLTTIAFAAAAAVSLASCSVNLTVAAQEVADEAAQALLDQVGADLSVRMDCGDEPFDLVVDETRVCALSVEGEDPVYDATIVFTEVDGTSYSLDVTVADQAR